MLLSPGSTSLNVVVNYTVSIILRLDILPAETQLSNRSPIALKLRSSVLSGDFTKQLRAIAAPYKISPLLSAYVSAVPTVGVPQVKIIRLPSPTNNSQLSMNDLWNAPSISALVMGLLAFSILTVIAVLRYTRALKNRTYSELNTF